MDNVADCLLTCQPKKFKFTGDLFTGPDPVAWSIDLCRANAQNGLRIEAMGNALPELVQSVDSTVKLNPKNPAVLETILTQIGRAYAGHANLELNHIDSILDESQFEPTRAYYKTHFEQAAKSLHPLGHYMKASLWLSASKHCYTAHVDLADGFLFQLAGVKRVKVWPTPDKCQNLAVYNFSNLEFRKSTPYQEYTLEAGDVLFIPGGAVHEVTVDVGYISVSISYHIGCPYPLMALCNELGAGHGEDRFVLEDKHKKTKKFDITFFDAGFGLSNRQAGPDGMSAALCEELCKVISSNCCDDVLANYLREWWLTKLENPTYLGPYAW